MLTLFLLYTELHSKLCRSCHHFICFFSLFSVVLSVVLLCSRRSTTQLNDFYETGQSISGAGILALATTTNIRNDQGVTSRRRLMQHVVSIHEQHCSVINSRLESHLSSGRTWITMFTKLSGCIKQRRHGSKRLKHIHNRHRLSRQ